MTAPPPDRLDAFYATAHAGLGILVRQGLLRDPFDEDNRALWRGVGGHLSEVDHLDLVIADAAVRWPLAFAPVVVFGYAGLADDEAFPPLWPGSDPNLALRRAQGLPPSGAHGRDDATAIVAAGWQKVLPAVQPALTAKLSVNASVVVGGAQALASVIAWAAADRDVDLGRQVTLVSADPLERQWLGLAAAAQGAQTTPRVLSPVVAGEAKMQRELGKATVVLSVDAARDVRRVLDPVARPAN